MTELLYGRQAVVEALRAGQRKIVKLLVVENAQRKGVLAESITLAEGRNIPVRYVPRAQLPRTLQEAQGIVAEANEYPYVDVDMLLAASGEPRQSIGSHHQPNRTEVRLPDRY